jgi:hypothetical protein
MENNTPTFTLCMAVQSDGKVYQYEFYTHFFTEQEREAFAATMPKSFKKYYTHLGGQGVVNAHGLYVVASLAPTKNNAKNETGIKRFRKFIELYGNQIECLKGFSNSVKTLDEAIAHVNAWDAN